MRAMINQGGVAATGSGRVEVAPTGGPRLLDRLREALRSRHYSRRTEQTYCHWVKRFILILVVLTAQAAAHGQECQEQPRPRPILLTTDTGADMDDQWVLAHLVLIA